MNLFLTSMNFDGYMDDTFKINSLYYADDVMILADSIEGAERRIDELMEVSGEYGLKII